LLQTLIDRPPIRIDHLAGDGGTLMVSFSSIGHDPAQMPSQEFVATLRGLGPALFVMDAARSWGNVPGFLASVEAAIASVHARQSIDRVVMIGQSMGAYAAMVAAKVIATDTVIAFGPQPRIDPVTEPRWRDWTARIVDPAFPICPMPMVRALWLFHGLQDDHANALAFEPSAQITHVLFPDRSHHDLCPHLKSRGVLRGLVEAIVSGERRRALRIVASAGGVRRQRLG
jgi:hypothetical protein